MKIQKYIKFITFTCALLSSVASSVSFSETPLQVLYVTHKGTWHDYDLQLTEFRKSASKRGWNTTISSGTSASVLKFLRGEKFALGFDVIVYNFCFGNQRDTETADNIIRQTTVGGVPALLLHCTMHSWWPTYTAKDGVRGLGNGKASIDPELLSVWKRRFPKKLFPIWGDFTGVASSHHGPKARISVKKLSEHKVLDKFPDNYVTTDKTELYNNLYLTKELIPLLSGKQTIGDKSTSSIVMWEAPMGKSKIIGLTLGHSLKDWQDREFISLLVNSVEYLGGKTK